MIEGQGIYRKKIKAGIVRGLTDLGKPVLFQKRIKPGSGKPRYSTRISNIATGNGLELGQISSFSL